MQWGEDGECEGDKQVEGQDGVHALGCCWFSGTCAAGLFVTPEPGNKQMGSAKTVGGYTMTAFTII